MKSLVTAAVLAGMIWTAGAHASLIVVQPAAEGHVLRQETWSQGQFGPVSSVDFSTGSDLQSSHFSTSSAAGPPNSTERRFVTEYDLAQFDDPSGLLATLEFDVTGFATTVEETVGFTMYWYAADGELTTGDFAVSTNTHVEVFSFSDTGPNVPSQFSFDVSTPFQQALANDVSHIGFVGVMDQSPVFSDETSLEFSSPSFNVIPEPGTGALLALGGLSLLLRRRLTLLRA